MCVLPVGSDLDPRSSSPVLPERAAQARSPAYLGSVVAELDDLPPIFGPGRQLINGEKYAWHPSSALVGQLPPDFSFPMRCLLMPDQLRRFYPSSFKGLIARGFEGGLAILSVLYNLSSAQRFAFRAMYLFFSKLRESREHFQNKLLNAGSLCIARSGRDLAEEKDILPASLGRTANGDDEKWGVTKLLEKGRERANAAGIIHPTEAECVHYGFVAGAELNPLYIGDEKALPLVRMVLYESVPWDDEEARKPAVLRFVVQRALTAVWNHLPDSADIFDAWLAGPKNSFVQQIAKQKRRPGGVLDRDLVRWALQELGWEAYHYVAECIHSQLWLFERLFPETLSDIELRWFEQMHLPQPHFGNLPLVLLVERFPLLHSVLWEIWDNPGNREPVAVLHRLLSYYAEMASTRRQIDRRVQQRRDGTQLTGGRRPLIVPLPRQVAACDDAVTGETIGDDARDGIDEELIWSTADPDAAAGEVFASLAELVRKRKNVHCSCATPAWEDRVIQQDEDGATIEHVCSCCGFGDKSTASLDELTSLATSALQE